MLVVVFMVLVMTLGMDSYCDNGDHCFARTIVPKYSVSSWPILLRISRIYFFVP